MSVGEPTAVAEVLTSTDKVALDHGADDVMIAAGDLVCHIFADIDLPFMPLAAVRVTEIDHQVGCQTGPAHCLSGLGHRFPVVVRALTAAQDDVGVAVAAGVEDR